MGPLVLKFFRGRWCPYCATELETWRDLYGQIREHGAVMVAIGPQMQRQSDFMVGQHGLPFPVLTDASNEVAEKFGLVYSVPEYHRAYYMSILVNIPFVNGEKSWRLPLPATYVIAKGPKGRFGQTRERMPTFAFVPSRKRRWRHCWKPADASPFSFGAPSLHVPASLRASEKPCCGRDHR